MRLLAALLVIGLPLVVLTGAYGGEDDWTVTIDNKIAFIEPFGNKKFTRLIHAGRYEEAARYGDYLLAHPSLVYPETMNEELIKPPQVPIMQKIAIERLHIAVCMAYAVLGEGTEALKRCREVSRQPLWPCKVLQYLHSYKFQKNSPPQCTNLALYGEEEPFFPLIINTNYSNNIEFFQTAEALAYYRLGEYKKALDHYGPAIRVNWQWQLVLVNIENALGTLKMPLAKELDYTREGAAEKNELQAFDRLRADYMYGAPRNGIQRVSQRVKVFYFEHPYGRLSPYIALFSILFIGLVYYGRNQILAGTIASGRGLRRLFLWNAEKRRARRQSRFESQARASEHMPLREEEMAGIEPPPTTQAVPIPSYPASPPAAAPMPTFFMDWRYPNRAYRYASYCWGAFWLVLVSPLLYWIVSSSLMILLDFGPGGFGRAVTNLNRIMGSFFVWGRIWFGLLLLSGTSYAVLKIYGRFSLPKHQRPRIRYIYATSRLGIVAVLLLSIVAIATAFIGAASNVLMNNPLVEVIRKVMGL